MKHWLEYKYMHAVAGGVAVYTAFSVSLGLGRMCQNAVVRPGRNGTFLLFYRSRSAHDLAVPLRPCFGQQCERPLGNTQAGAVHSSRWFHPFQHEGHLNFGSSILRSVGRFCSAQDTVVTPFNSCRRARPMDQSSDDRALDNALDFVAGMEECVPVVSRPIVHIRCNK